MKKPSPFTQLKIEMRQMKQELTALTKILNREEFVFSDPFEFAKLYNEQDCKVLLYYQGAYFDRKGKSKGLLYDIIKPDVKRANFLTGIADKDLPQYLLPYKVNVVLAKELINGDLITTLGHIISPASYTIWAYRNRINNLVYIQHEGQQIEVNLGKAVLGSFVEALDDDKYKAIYKDRDFTNSRIENLFWQKDNK